MGSDIKSELSSTSRDRRRPRRSTAKEEGKDRSERKERKSKRSNNKEDVLPPLAAQESGRSSKSSRSMRSVDNAFVAIDKQSTNPDVRKDVNDIARILKKKEEKLVGKEFVKRMYHDDNSSTHSHEQVAFMASDAAEEEQEEGQMAEEGGPAEEGGEEEAQKAEDGGGETDGEEAAAAGPKFGGGFGNAAYGNMPPGPVEVPYGQPNSLEEQTKVVLQAVLDGLKEVVSNMVGGQNSCEDRDEIDPFCFKLQQQAQKIVEAAQKDAVYVEEVRHHHNRIPDLCDITRDYAQGMMIADLKRATNIRREVLTVIKGSAPDYELDVDEQDELRSIRNSLRRTFGGKKGPKNAGGEKEEQKMLAALSGEADALGQGNLAPSEVKANTSALGLAAFDMNQDEIDNMLRGPTVSAEGTLGGRPAGGQWAKELVTGS